MRVLQLVHGAPPHQRAGTEVYAARLADALRARGHLVRTLSIAPEPGAPLWSVHRDGALVRVANNAPYAGLRNGQSDRHVDRLIEAEEESFSPDILHIQHLAFASTTFRTRAPRVWTLHDAWAWCAAGGLLLREGAPCAGPSAACPACASGWVKDSPAQIRTFQLAALLGRMVDPPHLQRAWARMPHSIRALTQGPAARLSAGHLAQRQANIAKLASSCARIVSPSRWLASAATANGIGVTDVLPHGCDPTPSGPHTGPFVFLGTLAWHKGPDLVRGAWERAATGIPLRLHGRPGPDPSFRVQHDGPLDDIGVAQVLAGARALVLGSRWPENAPLVVLEARAAGCPVIAPAIGGLPELVEHGVDGWLYPPNDERALAACLVAAAATSVRPRPPPTFQAHVDGLLDVYTSARRSRRSHE